MKNLASAWVKAFADIEGTVKNATNPHYRSRFADLPSVINAIKPHLSAHGLAFWQVSHPHDRGIQIETILVHESGEQVSLGNLFVPAVKADPQGFGSAQTYCRRFSLQTAFGLPAFDDDAELAVAAQEREPDPMLVTLRQAAMNGLQALQDAYIGHKDSPGFAAIWRQHGASLKAAAQAVENDATE